MTSTTERFLRPKGPHTYHLYIDGNVVAQIIETRDGFDIQVGRAGGWETIHEELGGTLVGLANRLAEGEFDDDFRFDIAENPEPDQPSNMYFVRVFATPSQKMLESFTTDDPGRAVEAAREAQTFSLEERLGEFGLEWQREQAERGV